MKRATECALFFIDALIMMEINTRGPDIAWHRVQFHSKVGENTESTELFQQTCVNNLKINKNMITTTQPISAQHFDALYSINCLKLCKVAGALKHREIVGVKLVFTENFCIH